MSGTMLSTLYILSGFITITECEVEINNSSKPQFLYLQLMHL